MTLSTLLNSTPEGAAALAAAKSLGDNVETLQASLEAANRGETIAPLEAILDMYGELRRRCYDAARANDGLLMGPDAWLCYAMSEDQLQLSVGPAGIDCWGTCYSMQSMSNEHFSFFIEFKDLTGAK